MRVFLALVFSVFAAAAARAGSGSFDTAFNGTGVRIVDFSAFATGYSVRDAAMAVDAQGRATLGTVVITDTTYALGLARVLKNGRLDPTFGTQGVAYVPLPQLERVIALKLDASGRAYVAMILREPGGFSWRTCRLTAAGGIDATFFGANCANVVPTATALMTDMIVTDNGNPWMIGSATVNVAGTPRSGLAISQVNAATSTVHTEVMALPTGYLYTARAIADVGESIVVAGSWFGNGGADTDVTTYYVTRSGSNPFFFTSGAVVPFNRGGTNDDGGACLAREPNGLMLVGANVAQAGGMAWGTARLDLNLALDTTYASNGLTVDYIGNVLDYGRDIRLSACALGPDGVLNLAGRYTFTPVGAPNVMTAMAVYRMKNGARDIAFGGAGAAPGVAVDPPLAMPGSALHYYRPQPAPGPRYDTAEQIHATADGRLVVSGVSSTDNGATSGVVVARLHGDSLFGDGFSD
ncbi:MAG TPA: hypothetical protein VJ724_07790 [Tahibacter sp.]|nr:hypothetical protein [Tahibacter sp.]